MNTTSMNDSLVEPMDNLRSVAELINKVKADIIQQNRLEKGWDGYHGLPLSIETAKFAQSLVDKLFIQPLPRPVVVAGCDDAVQLVWHVGPDDIEISIYNVKIVNAWRLNNHSNQADEITFDGTELEKFVAVLKNWLRDMTHKWNIAHYTAYT